MEEFRYEDIVNMSYPNADIEKAFPGEVLRAAQFAPFAALTGYDEEVKEAARRTVEEAELDEYEKELINNKLCYMKDHLDADFRITYFVPDEKKDGGEYVTYKGKISRIKEFEGLLVTELQTEIPICFIREIEQE